MTIRQLGVEEELILVDQDGAPAPLATEVIAGGEPGTDDVALVREFFLAQVEVVTAPTRSLAEIGRRLQHGRSTLRAAAEALGVRAVAVGGPVVDAPNGPRVRDERFDGISRVHAGIADDSLMCAVQVHVEVESRDEGVGVVDRVRPWVPLLLAISANSPYWHGRDTGFASWRSQVWGQWPSAGPTELLGDAAAYDALTAQMLHTGAIADAGLLNLPVRLSARYPTVEYRVADACTSLQDALVVAALSRALTETAARELRRGVAPAPWRVDQLRVAGWRAARFGLAERLLDPVDGSPVPARDALDTLVRHTAGALDDAGDLALVTDALARLCESGTGADRQRRSFDRHGDLVAVVADLARATS